MLYDKSPRRCGLVGLKKLISNRYLAIDREIEAAEVKIVTFHLYPAFPAFRILLISWYYRSSVLAEMFKIGV